jgi:MFS family permease
MIVQRSGGGSSVYRHSTRTIWAASSMIAFVVLIPLMIGVTSSKLMDDIGVSAFGIGLAMAVFWAVTAVSAWLLAPLADRLGWRLAGAAGLGATAAVQLVLGALDVNTWGFVLLMAAAGLAYGLVTPASNVAVVSDVSPGRRGLAIGAKQAAAPLAGLVAGAAVPVIVLWWDWRWAYIVGALLTAAAALVVAASPSSLARERGEEAAAPRSRPRGGGLALLAVGGALATVPVSALSTYAVMTLEATGLTLSGAGLVVAVASALSVVARLLGGTLVDRTGTDGLLPASVLIAIGASGALLMTSGDLAAVVAGAVIAFSAGWAWPGLVLVGILRASPGAAGRATGRFQVGTALGATAGPMLYVLAASALGTHLGWLVVAVFTAAAVPCILLGKRTLAAIAERPRTVEEEVADAGRD